MKKVKLMTKEIESKMPALYSTDGKNEKEVAVKFFTPFSNWTWYVFEGQKQENGDWLFFGMVEGFEKELGYFSLSELEAVNKGKAVQLIERDRLFDGVYNCQRKCLVK